VNITQTGNSPAERGWIVDNVGTLHLSAATTPFVSDCESDVEDQVEVQPLVPAMPSAAPSTGASEIRRDRSGYPAVSTVQLVAPAAQPALPPGGVEQSPDSGSPACSVDRGAAGASHAEHKSRVHECSCERASARDLGHSR
jgi:hypothetical protein